MEKAIHAIILLAYYLLAVLGLYRLARGFYRGHAHAESVFLLLGVCAYFLAVIAVAGGVDEDARVRLPVTFMVCIFAAAGFFRARRIEQQPTLPV
jgi:multisubunit Na+/H+ antiporter MnhG subunit